VSGAGAEIWSAECAKSRLYEHLQFKFFPGIILQTPLNGEGGKEGVGQEVKGREKSRDDAGDKGI
jgi:hypothetical protein